MVRYARAVYCSDHTIFDEECSEWPGELDDQAGTSKKLMARARIDGYSERRDWSGKRLRCMPARRGARCEDEAQQPATPSTKTAKDLQPPKKGEMEAGEIHGQHSLGSKEHKSKCEMRDKSASKAERRAAKRRRRNVGKEQKSSHKSPSSIRSATDERTTSPVTAKVFDHTHPTPSAVDPKSEEEAHRSFVISNERGSNMPKETGLIDEERQKTHERISGIDGQGRNIRNNSTQKQVETHEHSGMEVDRGMQDDSEGMRDEMDQMREADKLVKKRRQKKRKRKYGSSGRAAGEWAESEDAVQEDKENLERRASGDGDAKGGVLADLDNDHPSKRNKNDTADSQSLPRERGVLDQMKPTKVVVPNPGFRRPMMQRA